MASTKLRHRYYVSFPAHIKVKLEDMAKMKNTTPSTLITDLIMEHLLTGPPIDSLSKNVIEQRREAQDQSVLVKQQLHNLTKEVREAYNLLVRIVTADEEEEP